MDEKIYESNFGGTNGNASPRRRRRHLPRSQRCLANVGGGGSSATPGSGGQHARVGSTGDQRCGGPRISKPATLDLRNENRPVGGSRRSERRQSVPITSVEPFRGDTATSGNQQLQQAAELAWRRL